ncbi:SDR family oxidoreductase [Geomonas sp. RF6]|uniref:glucose 1-dehydrogenase n=1 Tax=Geomonas sp. RF6 TaxID=2897342 RepID=UPI001E45453D|nr:glucose 1-dehydrogenase [Geomonas sp. RF6]UFS72758.1 SDR family oxidoreductase [Geomonas sp. RF6]
MNDSAKVAVVTGAGQGIGKGIAMHLVGDGYRVVIADIDAEAAEEAAAQVGAAALPVIVDVADEGSVQALFQATISRFGRLDALVNNAAFAGAHLGPVEQLELSTWNRLIATNLTGVFLCSKHSAALLRASRGSIVNIASTRALQSEADTEAYSASKGGVVALTHALAMSLGPEVRVNCISPGWIAVEDWKKQSRRKEPQLRPEDHAQHPTGRVGKPGDIASLAAYLLSDSASFITGQNFVVDGGMTRKMIYLD